MMVNAENFVALHIYDIRVALLGIHQNNLGFCGHIRNFLLLNNVNCKQLCHLCRNRIVNSSFITNRCPNSLFFKQYL